MAKSHKSLPRPTSRKTVVERLKQSKKNMEIINKLMYFIKKDI